MSADDERPLTPEVQRAALAAFLGERPDVADAVRTIMHAFEEYESVDPRAALAAAGRARRAWKQWEPRVIELIVTNRERKVPASEVADELGVSLSYVHRIAREYSRYAWRLDVTEDEIDGWQQRATGEDVAPVDDPAQLVEPVVSRVLADEAATITARVTIWRAADDGTGAAPVHTEVRPAPSE